MSTPDAPGAVNGISAPIPPGAAAGGPAGAPADLGEGSAPETQRAQPLPSTAVDVAVSLRVRTPQGEVLLDQVQLGDTVVGLRQLLAERPRCCMYTNYHLALVTAGKGKSRQLNDYDELSSVEGLQSGSTLRMVLDKYTGRTARQHVRRFREILLCPPAPQTTDQLAPSENGAAAADGGSDSQQPQAEAAPDARDEDEAARVDGELAAGEAAGEDKAAGEATGEAAGEEGPAGADPADELADHLARAIERQMYESASRQREFEAKMPPVEVPVRPDLEAFYPAPSAFARDAAESTAEAEAADEPLQKQLPQCVRSVVFSGWNPPPPNRRLLGDLFYLQATTLEGFSFHITATPSGFFINSTRGDAFNPAPSHHPCHAHTLVELLSQASPDFAREFANLLRIASEAAEVTHHPVASPWDAVLATPWQAAASLASGGVVASGTVGAARQWNADMRGGAHAAVGGGAAGVSAGHGNSGATPYREHRFDLNRAEESFTNAFGMEERGTVRDWNEEYQCIKELPRDTIDRRIARARSLSKIQSEFIDAATQGAVAIVQGHIPPLNPMDEQDMWVFVHNNIFYSLGVDGRGIYEGMGGDEAAYKGINHDLLAVRAVDAADVEGLHTLATAVVDYCGTRLVAQSIIPGILVGHSASTLVYGSVDGGKSIASEEHTHELIKRAMSALHVAEREVEPGAALRAKGGAEDGPAAAEEDEESRAVSVQHAKTAGRVAMSSAVETKGILGSDGRRYVLDMMRITPRDPHFVDGEGAERGAKPGKGRGKGKRNGGDASTEGAEGTAAAEDGEGTVSAEGAEGVEGAVPTIATVGNVSARGTYTALLRPELVPMFLQHRHATARREAVRKALEEQQRQRKQKAGEGQGDGGEVAEKDGGAGAGGEQAVEARGADGEKLRVAVPPPPTLSLNLNVFTNYAVLGDSATEEERAQLAADEAVARELGDFLRGVAIPGLIYDAARGALQVVDGASLAEAMHARGINMRYLGLVAMHALRIETRARRQGLALLQVAEMEMVARAVKHMLRRYFRASAEARAAPAPLVAQLLNLLLGRPGGEATPQRPDVVPHATKTGAGRKGGKKAKAQAVAVGQGSAMPPAEQGAYAAAAKLLPKTHEDLWRAVGAEAQARFGFTPQLLGAWTDEDAGENQTTRAAVTQALRVPLLRRVAQVAGLRVASRAYDFSQAAPVRVEDVEELLPVVKHSLAEHPIGDAHEMLEAARLNLSARRLNHAFEFAHEALLLLYQVCGASHQDTARCCATLAMILYQGNDVDTAVAHQKRAVALYERVLGFDHPTTARAHANLALFLHAAGRLPRALVHMRRAIYLLEVAGGTFHAEAPSVYTRLGQMFLDVGHWQPAVPCFLHAIARSVDGAQKVHCLRALASAWALSGDLQKALSFEKAAFEQMKELFGEDDKRTSDVHITIRALTKLSVAVAQRQRELQREELKKRDEAETVAALKPSSAGGSRRKKNKSKSKKGKK